MKISVIYLAIIIYELNERNYFNNKKFNIKLLLKSLIKIFKEEFNIKLTKIFIINTQKLL